MEALPPDISMDPYPNRLEDADLKSVQCGFESHRVYKWEFKGSGYKQRRMALRSKLVDECTHRNTWIAHLFKGVTHD